MFERTSNSYPTSNNSKHSNDNSSNNSSTGATDEYDLHVHNVGSTPGWDRHYDYDYSHR